MPLSEETVGGYLSSNCFSHGIVCSGATTSSLGTPDSIDSYTYYQQWDTDMWGDGLKSYNGSATFTYDEVGNPLTYNNGSAYTFTWQNGRQLASTVLNGVTSSYEYNADGLRTQKTVGTTVYDYYWFGSQLAMMTITSGSSVMTLKFYYDANGLPLIFDYNGTQYHYITNLQGDVVGLANEYGIVATYGYDAFGKGNEDMEDTVHDVYVVLPQVERKLGVNGKYYYIPQLAYYIMVSAIPYGMVCAEEEIWD